LKSVTLPRQTGGKFGHHLERGHDEEGAQTTYGRIQGCGGSSEGAVNGRVPVAALRRRDHSLGGSLVRWYCRYGISYRELKEMMAERGVVGRLFWLSRGESPETVARSFSSLCE
jgi:hypothetical protein